VQTHGTAEVTEPVHAEIAERHGDDRAGAQQEACRFAEHDLPAVRGRADPCRAVHVEAEVVVAGPRRLARVQADPDPHRGPIRPRPGREVALDRDRGGDRVVGPRERDEEPVARGADLMAAVRGDRRPDDRVMRGEQLGVASAQALEQPRRALDVAEQEGDRARGQRGVADVLRAHDRLSGLGAASPSAASPSAVPSAEAKPSQPANGYRTPASSRTWPVSGPGPGSISITSSRVPSLMAAMVRRETIAHIGRPPRTFEIRPSRRSDCP
jgi:hypothetical protein